MNNNDKLGLIERVDHASEDQAKRTLKAMILKCDTNTVTIARAIKDAVERHTPTPTIVYQQPETADDNDATPATSDKKNSKRKKPREGQGSDGDEVLPTSSSRKFPKSSRGDINADPLVSELILGEPKTKRKKAHKSSDDRGKHQKKTKSSKSKKLKQESEIAAKTAHRNSKESVGNLSGQNDPIIIDLVSSSEHDERDSKQLVDENLGKRSSANVGSRGEGSGDDVFGSDEGESDILGSEQPARDVFDKGVTHFKDTSKGEPTAAIAGNCDDGHVAAQLSANTRTKTATQNRGIRLTSAGSTRKRKASEGNVDDANINQGAKSATDAHVHKKATQNHSQDAESSPENRTCQKCGARFPSIGRLSSHQLFCRDLFATLDSHLRSEPLSVSPSNEVQQSQKVDNPAGSMVTEASHSTVQLPSRPIKDSPVAPVLSAPPPSTIREPNNLPLGPTPRPILLAHQASGVNSLPSRLGHRPVTGASSDRTPHQPSESSELKSRKGNSLQDEKTSKKPLRAIHQDNVEFQCKFCTEWFKTHENLPGACRRHPGTSSILCRINPLISVRPVPYSHRGTADARPSSRSQRSSSDLSRLDMLPPSRPVCTNLQQIYGAFKGLGETSSKSIVISNAGVVRVIGTISHCCTVVQRSGSAVHVWAPCFLETFAYDPQIAR